MIRNKIVKVEDSKTLLSINVLNILIFIISRICIIYNCFITSRSPTVKALATLPLKTESSLDDEDLSPVAPLPLYQQRENYYS